MPLYEYQCTTCGKNFEASQRMSDPVLTSCTCGENGQVQRLLSAGSGLIFKGSGFYITDYKNAKSSPAAGASGESTSTAPAKTESAPSAPAAAPAASTGGGSCGSGGCPSCA